MARRGCPIARVRLYEPGVRSRAKYDGFGRYDLAGDLMRRNQVQVSPVEALGLWDGQGYRAVYPAAMHVAAGGLDTVVCRPFLDTTQAIGLGHFAPVAGRWRALRGLGLNEEVRLYQEDGTPNIVTGVESRFTLPRNPMFALALWRAEPGSGHDWGQPPYTEVHFGVGEQEEWAIVIPYGSPMYLVRRLGGQWERLPHSERALGLPSLEGLPKGQRSFLWVGVLEGKVVLSTDGFADDVMVCTLADGPAAIRQGKVSLWHNAGQWSFSFFPVKMVLATVHSGPIETGYPTRESTGVVRVEGRSIPVIDDAGQVLAGVEVTDDTAEREGLGVTQRSWRVRMMPHLHYEGEVGTDPDTGEAVEFSTWVSPEWLATHMWQEAQVEVDEGLESADISGDVIAVSGERTDDLLAARYGVRVDGQLGGYKELSEHRRVTVALGWEDDEGHQELRQVCDGYVVEPPAALLSGGAAETEIGVLDGMLRLRDEKAEGRTPVFDGWPVAEVFRWVLGRCGIAAAQQSLEDTGVVLTTGSAAKPLWQVEAGRTWSEFLQEVARFDYNAAFWFGGDGVFRKGCRYCRQMRTAQDVARHSGGLGSACPAEVTWELYTRDAVAPDPAEPGEVLELRRERRSLGSEDYANWVVVCGLGSDGAPVRAVLYDAASVSDPSCERFVGWRKMDVWTLPGMVGQDTVNRLAAERLAQLSPRPEHVVVVTPLLPEAEPGQVIRVSGGERVGVTRQLYRISGVRHQVVRDPERLAVTVLEAWWLGSGE